MTTSLSHFFLIESLTYSNNSLLLFFFNSLVNSNNLLFPVASLINKTLKASSGDKDFLILPNDKIAQMVIAPVIYAEFIKVDKLKDTNRGEKGYGSTGKT